MIIKLLLYYIVVRSDVFFLFLKLAMSYLESMNYTHLIDCLLQRIKM